jgi:RNA polymerase sigma factor (sigma-70 family)
MGVNLGGGEQLAIINRHALVASDHSGTDVIGEGIMTQVSQVEIADDLVLAALQDAQKGDQFAWETLFKECYPKVRRVVRRRLNRSMRSLYDSTDFANDAMESLAANFDQLEFPSVNSLIAFLAQVAEQKVIDEYRRQHTLKRDMGRDRPNFGNDGGPSQLWSDDPSASQLAQANEVHERLISRPDVTERAIIELKEQGHTTSDIAERTGWNIRKVQRFLQNLHDSLTGSGD